MREGHRTSLVRTVAALIPILYCINSHAVPFDGSDKPENVSDATNLIEDLIQEEMEFIPGRLAVPSVVDESDARRALDALQSGLRDSGDLASIALLAPAIRRVIPENLTIRFLHAISLAAAGNPGMAENAIAAIEAREAQDRFYAALAAAMIDKASGDFSGAIASAQAAIALDNSHPFPHNIIGQAQVEQRDLELAEASFRRAIALGPGNVAAQSNLAAALFLRGRSDDSLAAYNLALATSPGYCPALIGRSMLYEQQRAYRDAVTDLERCAKGPTASRAAKERLVNAYLLAGQPADAKAVGLTLLTSNQPFARTAVADAELRMGNAAAARDWLAPVADSSNQASYLLGLCDLLEGDTNSAIARFDDLTAKAPDRPGAQLAATVGRFYVDDLDDFAALEKLAADPQIGSFGSFVAGTVRAAAADWGGASGYWAKAEGIVPGFTLAGVTPDDLAANLSASEQRLIALGTLYYLRQMYIPAVEQFGDALSENPDSFLGHYFKATMHQQLGQLDSTETHLKRSFESFDGFFPVSYSLADINLARGDTAQAIAYYEAAADVVPHAGALVRLGLLYENEGDLEKAEGAYRRFVETYPDNYIAQNQLAWFYAKRGENLDEALRLAQRANKLNPGNISINDTLGWIYFHRQDFAAAMEFLETANQVANESNPDVLFHIAAVKHAMGDTRSATRMLDEVLTRYSQFESLEDARRLQATIEESGG